MKFQGKFRTVSVVLVASAAIMLSGCGVTSAASSQQTGQHVARTGKTAVRTTVKTKQSVSKTPNWANMTAEQLGQYVKIHGGAPFGGTDVVRVKADRAEAAIPNNFKMSFAPMILSQPRASAGSVAQPGNVRFKTRDFVIVDSWKGKLKGKSFLLDVYVNKDTRQAVVGVSYAHHPILAYDLRSNRYLLRNFVGSYVVFASPSFNGAYYPINLTTGRVITALEHHLLVLKLEGCYPCVGAAGAEWITGLPKKYPFNP
ncbi:MAG: hypothetical protein ACYCYO_01735 [Bacilli bacterium]